MKFSFRTNSQLFFYSVTFKKKKPFLVFANRKPGGQYHNTCLVPYFELLLNKLVDLIRLLSNPTWPIPTQPDLTQPHPTQPNLTLPNLTTWYNPIQPYWAWPKPTRPNPAEPDLTWHKLSRPSMTQPNLTRSDLTRPYQYRPDPTRTDQTQPNPIQCCRKGLNISLF